MKENKIIKDVSPFKMVNVKIKDGNHWNLFKWNCIQEYIDFYNDIIYNNGNEKTLAFSDLISYLEKDFLYKKGNEKSFAKVNSTFGEIYRVLKSEYRKNGNKERAEDIINKMLRLLINNLLYCTLITPREAANFPIPNLEYFDMIKDFMMKNKKVSNDEEMSNMKLYYIHDFYNGVINLSSMVEKCIYWPSA